MAVAVAPPQSDMADRETQLLMLQLQLEDLNHLVAKAKGKGREGETCDKDISLGLLKEDLNKQITALNDQALCHSIAKALRTDHAILETQRELENLARRDREVALSMSRGHSTPHSTPQNQHGQQENALDDETLAKFAMLYVSEEAAMSVLGFDCDDEKNIAESSEMAARRAARHAAAIHQCVACEDHHKISNIARVPCRHEYCGSCLGALFTAAMKDEAYYPPRCCREPILLDKVKMFLPTDIAEEYQAKLPELETKDRTYCHVPNCSA
ncbi:Epithelial splicing regulatory protein 1 [Elsinoe australis]|uniref:Epithelial splicing regulatory protein 1 n=1 Tax=Elsinoe australis TaxID=40998 RepID=A0A2P8AIR3_9PEZI|nr:Epithelial splicing regulatory protein 1 [Elsinoe australis]